jgi:hypothetical protein
MPTPAAPVAIWDERPDTGVATALTRLRWHFDAASSSWTLTDSLSQESGRLAAVSPGVYALVRLEDLDPAVRVKRITRGPSVTSRPIPVFLY